MGKGVTGQRERERKLLVQASNLTVRGSLQSTFFIVGVAVVDTFFLPSAVFDGAKGVVACAALVHFVPKTFALQLPACLSRLSPTDNGNMCFLVLPATDAGGLHNDQ